MEAIFQAPWWSCIFPRDQSISAKHRESARVCGFTHLNCCGTFTKDSKKMVSCEGVLCSTGHRSVLEGKVDDLGFPSPGCSLLASSSSKVCIKLEQRSALSPSPSKVLWLGGTFSSP